MLLKKTHRLDLSKANLPSLITLLPDVPHDLSSSLLGFLQGQCIMSVCVMRLLVYAEYNVDLLESINTLSSWSLGFGIKSHHLLVSNTCDQSFVISSH